MFWSLFAFCAFLLSMRFAFSPIDGFVGFWLLGSCLCLMFCSLCVLRFSPIALFPSLSSIALYIRGYCVSCEIRKGEAEVVEFCVVVDACCFLLKLTTVLA